MLFLNFLTSFPLALSVYLGLIIPYIIHDNGKVLVLYLHKKKHDFFDLQLLGLASLGGKKTTKTRLLDEEFKEER